MAVVGATATGKTELAVALAERTGGEILNMDASCVHRGLDIGTAKPSAEQRRRVPHHLLDVREPHEAHSAADHVRLAEPVLAELAGRGTPAVLVGGSGLYLRCLLHGMASAPRSDEAGTGRLLARESRRPGSLHRLLRRLDPVSARGIPPGNVRRTVRALEVTLRTGRPASADRTTWGGPAQLACVKVGLRLDRPAREARIRERVDAMLAAGLVEEVRGLLASGLDPEARSLRAIGYRQVVEHLQGRLDEGDLAERIAIATRQLAKRQDTWFRREPRVTWFAAARDAAELPALVDRVMMALRGAPGWT